MIMCAVYVCIITPQDFVPIIGWLDEATVVGFIVYLHKKYKAEKEKETAKLQE